MVVENAFWLHMKSTKFLEEPENFSSVNQGDDSAIPGLLIYKDFSVPMAVHVEKISFKIMSLKKRDRELLVMIIRWLYTTSRLLAFKRGRRRNCYFEK